MPKKKPCNLTKAEWALFTEIFQYFHDEHDLSDKEIEQMQTIHEKLFFMDYLARGQE